MSTSSMHVAKTGLNAQQTRMQIIANNLANVSTTGFKRDRANFETLLIKCAGLLVIKPRQTNLTSSFSVGTGARIVNTQKNMSQGSMITTDNSLDLAIEGTGFFQVLLPDGRIGYTRNGSFSTNAEGTLTTPVVILFSLKFKYQPVHHKLIFLEMESLAFCNRVLTTLRSWPTYDC